MGRVERAKARVEKFRAFLNRVTVEEYRELQQIRLEEEKRERKEFERWKVKEKYRKMRVQAREAESSDGVRGWLGRRADAFEEKAPSFYGLEKEKKK